MRMKPKHLSLLVLTLLVVAAPFFFPSGFYYRIGALIFINAIAVTGLVILIGYAGQISLGHAGFAGIGAYACALAPEHLGLPPVAAILLGTALSAALAWLVGKPILRLHGYYLGVATLGLGILISMVLSNEAQWTGGPDGIAVPDLGLRGLLRDLGWRIGAGELWYGLAGTVMILGAWLALNLFDSPTGRALRALHGSEVAARTMGIDVARHKLHAFVVSAVYASVSGSLLALMNRLITPDVAGFMHSVQMVTMAVLGGVGSVLGAIFGATILTALPQLLTVFHQYEHMVLGLVMILVMIFLPDGLLPSLMKRLRGRDGE
ncbi:branched-chain amino acid ABC transporter permease [Pararhodobacter aggregans]|uniref:Branched-chain amino acid ABC transporter permease n=1 Tax=Pararhodobacter aggregans TaxID=404875 RepID=A0A2T7UNI7_9RHOB|nr:branched-chain amino acid ABC transporter permease [Pararhodobacter aggregans]